MQSGVFVPVRLAAGVCHMSVKTIGFRSGRGEIKISSIVARTPLAAVALLAVAAGFGVNAAAKTLGASVGGDVQYTARIGAVHQALGSTQQLNTGDAGVQ